MKKNRYLVISPNSYGNLGDDICAYGGKAAILEADPMAEVIVSQPPMIKQLVQWADFVVLSGGGIIYDRAPDNVANYMKYLDYAAELGKKSAVIGVGYQGIVTDKGRKHYHDSLSKAEFVSLRTAQDKELLDRETGITNSYISFDIAFHFPQILNRLKPGLQRRMKIYKFHKQLAHSDNIKIGMSILDLKKMKKDNYGGNFKIFDESLENYLKNRPTKVEVYLLQHAKEDGELQRRLAVDYNCTFIPYASIKDVPGIFKIYQQLDLIIGLRLHSIALGLMAQKPVIGIGSEHAKQLRLARFNLSTLERQFISLNNPDAITALFENLLSTTYLDSLKTLSETEYNFIEKQKAVDINMLKKLNK